MDISNFQEGLSALYLRLNGFFVSGFIVHAPENEFNDKGKRRANRTEVDILAVRFPYNAEPEREIGTSPFLATSSEYIDILICEVKGGEQSVQFNSGLREKPDAICTLLRWVGLFNEKQIGELIAPVMSLLDTQNHNNPDSYREYVVPTELLQSIKVRIRGILFAPDRLPAQNGQTKFIHGQELIDYVWACLRPEKPRPKCVTRYDFGLWGQYEPIIRFFKSAGQKPSNVVEIYKEIEVKMKKDYDAWQDEASISFTEAENVKREKAQGTLSENAKLLHTVKADTWEEAMAVHHTKMGWEPYIPEGEATECPNRCGAIFYPKGSGQCPNCGRVC